jgi:hypothetical protein
VLRSRLDQLEQALRERTNVAASRPAEIRFAVNVIITSPLFLQQKSLYQYSGSLAFQAQRWHIYEWFILHKGNKPLDNVGAT